MITQTRDLYLLLDEHGCPFYAGHSSYAPFRLGEHTSSRNRENTKKAAKIRELYSQNKAVNMVYWTMDVTHLPHYTALAMFTELEACLVEDQIELTNSRPTLTRAKRVPQHFKDMFKKFMQETKPQFVSKSLGKATQ